MKTFYVLMSYTPPRDYWLIDQIVRHGHRCVVMGFPNYVHRNRFKYKGLFYRLCQLFYPLWLVARTRPGDVALIYDSTTMAAMVGAVMQRLGLKRNVILMNMMDNSASDGRRKRVLYDGLRPLFIGVNSEALIDRYVERYRFDRRRFFLLEDCYSNFGIELLKKGADYAEDRGYVFCGGTTYRDWRLFVETARRCPHIPFIGVARHELFRETGLPANLTMYFDLDNAAFNDYLRCCRLLFMPLTVDTQGGQIVIFSAGLLRKPVVTTNTLTIRTYMDDPADGRIVPMSDAAAAAKAVGELYADESLRRELAGNLYGRICRFSPENFYRRIADCCATHFQQIE